MAPGFSRNVLAAGGSSLVLQHKNGLLAVCGSASSCSASRFIRPVQKISPGAYQLTTLNGSHLAVCRLELRSGNGRLRAPLTPFNSRHSRPGSTTKYWLRTLWSTSHALFRCLFDDGVLVCPRRMRSSLKGGKGEHRLLRQFYWRPSTRRWPRLSARQQDSNLRFQFYIRQKAKE